MMRIYCQSSSKPTFIKSIYQGDLIKIAMRVFIQKLEGIHITAGGN